MNSLNTSTYRSDRFPERLRQLRESKSLGHDELGSALGLSGNAIQQWERGLTQPTFRLIEQLADILGTSPSHLVFGYSS